MSQEDFNPDLVNNILLIVRSLFQKGVFSPCRENVAIERVGRNPIYPCGSYGSEGLDLSGLEWAAKEGKFWFLGPFKDLRIIMDKGPIQGDLQLEEKRMTFTTSLNTLNYNNFKAVAATLRKMAQQLGLELEFQSIGGFSEKLVISAQNCFSADNVNDFISKIHILHQSTDRV